MPASPAGSRRRAISRCEPGLIRVGASDSPTSENRNSISSARPREVTLTRGVIVAVDSCVFARETEIDMPTGVAGIVRARKSHRESAEVGSRPPASLSDELVEGGMKQRTVDGFPEGFVAVVAEADDWLCPGRRLLGIAGQVVPQNGAALFGKFARKGVIYPDEAVLNELLDLRVAERARWFAGRHENPLIAGQTATACAKQERPGCFGWRLPPA